jgi:hypothetical protein
VIPDRRWYTSVNESSGATRIWSAGSALYFVLGDAVMDAWGKAPALKFNV